MSRFIVERVAHLGAVDDDGRDGPGGLDQDLGLSHDGRSAYGRQLVFELGVRADRRAEVPPVLLRRPFLLTRGALAPNAPVESVSAAHEVLVRLIELQRMIAQL